MRATTIKYLNQHKDIAAPHTGIMIRSYMKGIGVNHADIGRRTDRNTTTVHALLKRHSMQSAIMWEMCHALKHNFFADLAAQLPEDYGSAAQNKLAAENAELKLKLAWMDERMKKG